MCPGGPQQGGSPCPLCAHFQCPAWHLHQTRMISIHPQINSKEVLWFTAALSAATREKGDAFIFLSSLIHHFSCLCPWQRIKLIFLLPWFCAALAKGMASPICEEHHGQHRPGSGAGSRREMDAREEGAGQQVLPDTGSPILQDLSSPHLPSVLGRELS